METINIVSPCFNEEDNLEPLYNRIKRIFESSLSKYDFKLIFIDNKSTDLTRARIKQLIDSDTRVGAIFNARNFGHIKSPFYGLLQSEGPCSILIASDLQDPPEMIVDMVRKWEEGFKVVVAVKTKTKENRFIFLIRRLYYSLVRKMSDIDLIDNFTGFGLYDRVVIQELRKIDDPYPYFRGLIAEIGFDQAVVSFTQPRRERGTTKNNFLTLYDIAMLGFTSTSKIPLRMATMLGFCMAGLSLTVAIAYLVLKILFWNFFPAGSAPMIIGLFFLGSVQLFFIGLVGEYILNINTKNLETTPCN